jgi:hypothetical protein
MTLEQELDAAVRRVGLSPRQRQAVLRRLGWDGRPPATLAAAGAELGYTSERVRQLEERTREQLAGRPLPAVAAAAAVIGDAAPAPRSRVARLLAERGVSGAPFDVGGVLTAADIGGVALDVVVDASIVLRREDAVVRPLVGRVARTLARRHGATTTAEIATLLGLRRARTRMLLDGVKGIAWLGDGWLTVDPPRGAVVSAMRKLLAFAPKASPDDVARAIGGPLPAPVVAQLLTLIAAGAQPTLSPTERLVADALRAEGDAASVRRIARRAAAAGVAPPTAAVCLSRSPLFRHVERGRWALAV